MEKPGELFTRTSHPIPEAGKSGQAVKRTRTSPVGNWAAAETPAEIRGSVHVRSAQNKRMPGEFQRATALKFVLPLRPNAERRPALGLKNQSAVSIYLLALSTDMSGLVERATS